MNVETHTSETQYPQIQANECFNNTVSYTQRNVTQRNKYQMSIDSFESHEIPHTPTDAVIMLLLEVTQFKDGHNNKNDKDVLWL